MVRAREVEQSIAIRPRRCSGRCPRSAARTAPPAELPAFANVGARLGRGLARPCLHWVETDASGTLTRVKVTDPSFRNWPGLALAVPGNIIPDFPVINKSFNLSYSGNDR